MRLGSSPHTRGARQPRRKRQPRERIIPAYAGSTLGTRRWWGRMRDHPRIRGEHTRSRLSALNSKGSSPHTRGAQVQLAGEDQPDRIIPAYAGSTRMPYRSHR